MEDVCERTKQMDTRYLLGLKKFFSVYLDTVSNTEPEVSAAPKLITLLHTYFSKFETKLICAGSRRIHVQPTAVARQREGVS